MPIDVNSCRLTPTSVTAGGSYNGSSFTSATGGVSPLHRLYTAVNCRVKLNPTMSTGRTKGIISLEPQDDPDGDTTFLPFAGNEIHSMVLPDALTATTMGINSFLTANLSGCQVFVDRVQGDGRRVVYHANNVANSPPAAMSARQPHVELPACTATLNQLYNNARADYAAAPYNMILLPEGNASKPIYNQGGQAEIMRKKGQGRTNVEFVGGTMVFGRVNGGIWEFFYTTYGDMEYDRPANAPLGAVAGTHRSVLTNNNPNYRVLSMFLERRIISGSLVEHDVVRQ